MRAYVLFRSQIMSFVYSEFIVRIIAYIKTVENAEGKFNSLSLYSLAPRTHTRVVRIYHMQYGDKISLFMVRRYVPTRILYSND